MKNKITLIGAAIGILINLGCSEPNREEKTTLAISRILFDNADVLYKSEINRMRVAFNHDRRSMIYHYWKEEQFEENGTLFFHLYPYNKSVLPRNREDFGFLNKNLNKDLFVTHDSINYFLVLKMPDYPISKITTGQFKGGKRSWFINEILDEKTEFSSRLQNDDNRLIIKNVASGAIKFGMHEGLSDELITKFEELLNIQFSKDEIQVTNDYTIYSSAENKNIAVTSRTVDCNSLTENVSVLKNVAVNDLFQFQTGNGCICLLKSE